ncbi:T7 tail fiber protein [Enterobacter hormaechei]|uniref:tail fiber/spike domain-containing protein n=2 Tax=Enterobacter hormaechei TaxID=158836 RepID=UPI000794728A|nr:hypothetical protein [Enterobacter hormaechei]SAB23987.1 T7 tail fiber protein [Enterobacter hormaechei]
MATTPTQNPVPSESPIDLKFNAGKIDEFVTSMGWTYTDRFGQKHYTIEGINYLAQQAMAAFGYVILTGKTFTTGATINNPNEVLLNTADGEYYKWTGSFASGPKVVPANSTPASTGGVGPGAWVGVGDASLRAALATSSGAGMVGYKNKGAYSVLQTVKDKLDRIYYASDYGVLTTNNAAVNTTNLQNMLNDLSGKSTITRIVFADQGTVFVNGPITVPNNTDIEIKSGVTVSGASGNIKPVFVSEKWEYVLSNRTVSGGFASNTSDLGNRSDYIGIWGGGTVDYNYSTGGTSNGMEMHCICIASASRVKLGGGLQIKGARKYSYLVSNVQYLDAQGLRFNNNSDGLHLQPPIDYAYVRDLYGTTGDDMFAMTGGDYLDYDLGLRGTFNHIDVKGIYGINSLCAVKVAGNSTTPVRHLSIDGVYGSYQHSVIRMWTDGPNLSQTDVKTLNIDNVGGIAGAGYRTIEFKTVGTGTVTVDNAVIGVLSANYSAASVPVISVTTGSAGSSAVRVYNLECRCPRDVAYFLEIGGDGAGADNSRIDNLKVNFDKTLLASSVTDANGIRITRGQINTMTLSGVIDAASNQAVVRKSSGKIERVIFDKLVQTNGFTLLSTGVNYDATTPTVEFIGGFYSNPDKLVSLLSGFSVICAGNVVSSKAGEVFTTTTGVVNVSGHMQYANSCIPSTAVSGVTWSVKGFGIFADVGNATAVRGNHCYNTNSSLGGGVGPVAANGSSWLSVV